MFELFIFLVGVNTLILVNPLIGAMAYIRLTPIVYTQLQVYQNPHCVYYLPFMAYKSECATGQLPCSIKAFRSLARHFRDSTCF